MKKILLALSVMIFVFTSCKPQNAFKNKDVKKTEQTKKAKKWLLEIRKILALGRIVVVGQVKVKVT